MEKLGYPGDLGALVSQEPFNFGHRLSPIAGDPGDLMRLLWCVVHGWSMHINPGDLEADCNRKNNTNPAEFSELQGTAVILGQGAHPAVSHYLCLS